MAGIADGTNNTIMSAEHERENEHDSTPAINPAAAFTLSSIAKTLEPH